MNSIFDLFKIIIGPSSSHTVGQMSATRDFCSIQNVTQVIQNILKEDSQDLSGVYNIGSGCETSLNFLYDCIVSSLQNKGIKISINQNRISFHEPNFYQGPLRWHYGDNRNDLHSDILPENANVNRDYYRFFYYMVCYWYSYYQIKG